jgi:hypothetical protein
MVKGTEGGKVMVVRQQQCPEKTKRYGVAFNPFGRDAQEAQSRDRCRWPRERLGFLGIGDGRESEG